MDAIVDNALNVLRIYVSGVEIWRKPFFWGIGFPIYVDMRYET